jgi:hypothetical protein
MEKERKLPPRKKVGPFNIDTMPPGTRRRAEEKNKGIRSRNVARAMSSSKDIPRRDTGDRPVVTKKNRGQQPTRRKARSLPRNVAKEMDPKGPPKGTKSSLERSKPTADAMTVTKTATKPKADAKATPKVAAPPKVTKRPQVTGEGTDKASRNVSRKGPMGKRTLANVTREQLLAAGLTTGRKGLNTYLNKFDELGRRPKPSDFKKPAEKKSVRRTGSARPMSERKFAKGGMMKSKMKAKGMKAGGKMTSKMKAKGMKAGGKMKTKGYMAGGLKDAPEGNTGLKKLPKQVRNKMGFKAKGGMMKTKGYAKGGMKTKGYMAGGKMKAKGMAKGGKVRGAGIARKGVRPAKMR